MMRIFLTFLMVCSLIRAADGAEKKSSLDVNLGTWDLGYNRQVTDRISLRIKAGWQDDKTTSDLTSNQWYHPDSLNPLTVIEETRNTDEQNLKLELAGMVRILKTNSGYVVAGAGYRAGRAVSTRDFQRDISSLAWDNEIISQTHAYDGELLTTYHGPVGIIQIQHQITPRFQFFAELNYRLEWRRSESKYLQEEDEDPNYHNYRRTEWDRTERVEGFEKLKVGFSFQF